MKPLFCPLHGEQLAKAWKDTEGRQMWYCLDCGAVKVYTLEED